MKRLKAGVVNSISFIRNLEYSVNSFDVTFDKVVGGTTLTLSDLEDVNSLDPCRDFIVLNIDLLSNELDGGEYYMTISNAGNSSTYLCEVESYVYNTLGNSIYGDSVVLSGSVGSTPVLENPDAGGSTGSNTGGGSTPSFDVVFTDNEIGEYDMIRTDTWLLSLQLSNVHPDIKEVNTIVTNTSGNQLSFLETLNAGVSVHSISHNLEEEAIEFGDIINVQVEGLDENSNVVYTSTATPIYLPPKVDMYIAESLTQAEDMMANGHYKLTFAEDDSSAYNLYAYSHSNVLGVNLNISAQGLDEVTGLGYSVDGFTTPIWSVQDGVMTEVSTDIVPPLSGEEYFRAIRITSTIEFPDGKTTPLIAPDIYNVFMYGVYSKNRVARTTYSQEQITIDNTSITLEGYLPFSHYSSYIEPLDPNTLTIQVVSDTYDSYIDFRNDMKEIKIQQSYSDGSVLEGNVTQFLTSSDTIIWQSPTGSAWDYKIYIRQLDTNKVPVSTKVWFNLDLTNGLLDGTSAWYNVNNNSVDAPHYLYEH